MRRERDWENDVGIQPRDKLTHHGQIDSGLAVPVAYHASD